MRISHSGSKAQYEGGSRKALFCRIVVFVYVVAGRVCSERCAPRGIGLRVSVQDIGVGVKDSFRWVDFKWVVTLI